MMKKIICLILCVAMCLGMSSVLTGCGGSKDAFVIMTEQLDGLFNPFYYTSAPETVVITVTDGVVTVEFVTA